MASSIPPVHVGDDVILSVRDNLYPIIEANEKVSIEDAKSHAMAVLGQSLQRYFNLDSGPRIENAYYETGQIVCSWYPGTVNPYPKPSFDNVHPFPYEGIIRLDDNGFFGANGYQYPLGIHFGDGFLCYTEGKDVDPILDLFVKYGFHFDRTWITLMWFKQGNSFWGDRGCSPRVTPNYYDLLRKWIEKHIARKLKMHLSIGDLNGVPRGEIESLYDNLASLIQEYGQEHFIFPGEVNESRDTFTGASGSDIASLVNRIRVKNPDILYCLTSYTGYADLETTELYTASYQKNYYKHGYRDGHYWDKVRHTFSDGYEYYMQIRKFGADHEHVGPGKWVSVTANKHELNASVMGGLAVMAALSRQSYVYFCSPGIKWDEDFHNMPGFVTCAELVNLLPKGLSGGILHHSGTSWRNIRVFSAVDEFRVDGSLNPNTGEFAYVGYGPGNKIRLPINRNFEGFLINPDSLEVTSLSGLSGDFLPEIGYNSCFVIIGRVI